MRSGSSRSLTFSARSLAKVNRLNLYLDVGNRSRHHHHRSPERHRTAVPNRCNDCRRDSVPCHRRGTCSKTTSVWSLRSACRRYPVLPDLPCESPPSRNVARDVVMSRWCIQNLLFRVYQRSFSVDGCDFYTLVSEEYELDEKMTQ